MTRTIRLLVDASPLVAMADAEVHGVTTAKIYGRRANGQLLLRALLEEYPAVLRWWLSAGTLIRTLGPEDAEQAQRFREAPPLRRPLEAVS